MLIGGAFSLLIETLQFLLRRGFAEFDDVWHNGVGVIALSNAKNVEIKYTGLREGEKLYEEVLNEMEGTKPTFHEKIRIAQVREYDYDEVAKEIDDLVEIAKKFDNMDTVRKMKEIVPEYKSNNSVYEVLDKVLIQTNN